MENYKAKGAQSKSKKCYYPYKKTEKDSHLLLGFKGFICTFNFQEKECIKESYNLLDEYAENFFKHEEPDEIEMEDADNLSQEIQKLKSQSNKEKRFRLVSCAKNMMFFQTIIEDPVKLAHYIVKDICENKKAKTRYLLRLIPIEASCKAHLDTLKQACLPLIHKHFSCECTSYSIVYNHRCDNNLMNKMEVISAVAELVTSVQPNHKVDLEEPHLSIVIEVFKSIAFIGVLPDFKKYKKYNIHMSLEQTNEKV